LTVRHLIDQKFEFIGAGNMHHWTSTYVSQLQAKNRLTMYSHLDNQERWFSNWCTAECAYFGWTADVWQDQCQRLKYRLFSILDRQENKNTILIADGHILKYKRKTIGDSRICNRSVGEYVCLQNIHSYNAGSW